MCTWPILAHCAASSPLGRKMREINYVSCCGGFDVKSWGKCCSLTFSLHLLYVIQRVPPPPKSPSPSCCHQPAFRHIRHVRRPAYNFDLNLVGKLFFLCYWCENIYSFRERERTWIHTCWDCNTTFMPDFLQRFNPLKESSNKELKEIWQNRLITKSILQLSMFHCSFLHGSTQLPLHYRFWN